jgi:hypothetical protein
MMSESIMEYVQKKAFENIIVSKLLEKMEELYLMRNDIEDCLKEVNAAIKDIENDFFKIMEKINDQ